MIYFNLFVIFYLPSTELATMVKTSIENLHFSFFQT